MEGRREAGREGERRITWNEALVEHVKKASDTCEKVKLL